MSTCNSGGNGAISLCGAQAQCVMAVMKNPAVHPYPGLLPSWHACLVPEVGQCFQRHYLADQMTGDLLSCWTLHKQMPTYSGADVHPSNVQMCQLQNGRQTTTPLLLASNVEIGCPQNVKYWRLHHSGAKL